ncbi:MAG: glutaminyl-peptide cyclotransferase [Ginsengibacter sp.]
MKPFKIAFVLLIAFVSCNNNSNPDVDSSLPVLQANNIPAPSPIMFEVNSVYPHDVTAFTQGLEYHNGKLYESTGEFGKSRVRIVDIKTGSSLEDHLVQDANIFGEGITIFKDKLYQLTWQDQKIFVYNLNDLSKIINTINWSRQGWGITNDGTNLIISDGTSKIYYVAPVENSNEMKIVKILTVVNNLGEVDSLNELEFINGFLFANVWLTDQIVKIDTANGHVVGTLNFKGLLQQYDPGVQVSEEAVLNGIAYDSVSDKLFITGKKWPKLFEIKLK